MADLFFGLFPIRIWRDFLIGLHIGKCPRCQSRLVSREEARALLVRAGDLSGAAQNLWPGIRSAIRKEKSVRLPARVRTGWKWGWAWGAAAVLAGVTGFWLLRSSGVPKLSLSNATGPDRFELEYVRVGGETANAYVYQPRDSDMVLVWAEKISQGGEL
jgi:hypothetical protein